MDHNRAGHRNYNEKEIGGLIQRATELHERATGASEHKLSLQEIEHIASELGLPPEHLQTAALELEDSLSSGNRSNLWGGPFVVDETRVVNETMTEEQWEDIVLELRRFTGRRGKANELGRSREWIHAVGEGDDGFNFTTTEVSMRPVDGKTSIRIRKTYGGVAFLFAVPVFLSLFFAVVLLAEQPGLVIFAFAGVITVGTFAAVRAFIYQRAKRHARRLARLADLLRDKLTVSSSSVLETEPVSELIELPERDGPSMELDDSERVSPAARRAARE